MPPAPRPHAESERLDALQSYEVLDSACEEAFDDLAALAARLTGCPIALVSLVDAERQWFKAHLGLGMREGPRDHAFCAHAILAPDQPLVVPDAARDPRFADNPLVTGDPGIRFYAGAPLVNPDGHALGTLCVIDRVPREMPPEQRETLAMLARAVTTTLELRRTALLVRNMALTDPLTGIANRRAFMDGLGRAIARQRRDGRAFVLIYADLDGFKQVNDRLGHAAGDAVLCAVAEAMLACLRREDLVARLGGDEFAAVIVGGGAAEVGGIGERMRNRIEACMRTHGWPVTASVGAVAVLSPPPDEATAMAAADSLLYAAKAAGKNRVQHRSLGCAEPPLLQAIPSRPRLKPRPLSLVG